MATLTRAPAPSAPAAASDTARQVGRNRITPYLLLLPGGLWLGIFFAIPTITLLVTSLYTGTLETGYRMTFAFSNYSVIGDYLPQFWRSFLYAGVSTALCLAVAYPLAYTIAFKAGRWKAALLVAVIAPFFTSFLIRTLAWISILNDDGPVVSVLKTLHITNILAVLPGIGTGQADRVLATPFAVVTGLTYNFLPFMVLPLYAALDRMDPRLVEAAQDLYCSPWAAFRKITWPLSLPGVVAGTLLTFIPAAGDYINSTLLGLRSDNTMIGNVIESKFFSETDYPAAAALSVVLMAVILTLVVLYVRRAGTEELV